MFNYQSEWLSQVFGRVANSSNPWRLVEVTGLSSFTYDRVYPEWPPFRQGIDYLGYQTKEWRQVYWETYHRVHPQIETWIRNTTLHYGTGVSVGVLASIILLLFLFSKVLPGRLKNLGYALMLMGTSVTFWILSYVGDVFSSSVFDKCVLYWQYVVGYCVVMGLLSFAVVYRLGPVTNERTLNLIQWLLQTIGLILIYNSTQIREVSIALMLITVSVYNFPRMLFINKTSRKYWNRFFPPKIKLLTEDEYVQQGNVETKKALEQLREYCRSPDCQSWRIISRLKSPQRFADFVQNDSAHVSSAEQTQHDILDDPTLVDSEPPSDAEFADFIEGNSWHISNEEMLEYDSDLDISAPYEQQPPQDNADDDDESEMDFVLSSP